MEYFKNNTSIFTIVDTLENELNMENDFDKITLYGTLVFTPDIKGFNRVTQLVNQLQNLQEEIKTRLT